MLVRLLTAALVALPMLLGAARAEAAIISGTITFSFPNAGPIDPFAGSFDITFDNSADIAETTTGLSNVVLPFALSAGVAAYAYYIDVVGTPDVFVLGGTENDVNAVNAFTNDFFLIFSGISTGTPTLFFFAYATAETFIFNRANGPVTLTFTRTPTAVPTPAALGLFGVGLLGLGALRRRAG